MEIPLAKPFLVHFIKNNSMTNKRDIYKADLTNASKENIFYSLAMFPYPSGAGLHVGHGMNFTANDIVARFKRMQ